MFGKTVDQSKSPKFRRHGVKEGVVLYRYIALHVTKRCSSFSKIQISTL